jgi:hypothetical protein
MLTIRQMITKLRSVPGCQKLTNKQLTELTKHFATMNEAIRLSYIKAPATPEGSK